jgi:hypothetical protein
MFLVQRAKELVDMGRRSMGLLSLWFSGAMGVILSDRAVLAFAGCSHLLCFGLHPLQLVQIFVFRSYNMIFMRLINFL